MGHYGLAADSGATMNVSDQRLMTNMYGYSVSYAALRESTHGLTTYRHYLQVGPLLKFAPLPHLNIGTQVNLAYTNNVGVTLHVSAFVSWVPRRGDFGIRASDKSPFF